MVVLTPDDAILVSTGKRTFLVWCDENDVLFIEAEGFHRIKVEAEDGRDSVSVECAHIAIHAADE